mmetsp:Transcript_30529/g.67662  ORF Transcript_30529/g.67662 Transcript_30529/m.67662 type:complete len:412 (+) Transcript_30529:154-1389(+)
MWNIKRLISRHRHSKSSTGEAEPLLGCELSTTLGADVSEHELLQKKGWDYFSVYAGGASGPRSFVTMGFDKQFSKLVDSGAITGDKWLLGGSTAALRFCALISGLISRKNISYELKEHFAKMVYKPGDTPKTLAPMMEALFLKVLPPHLADKVLRHPSLHLCIMVTQLRPAYQNLPEWQLKALFGLFLGANVVTPASLKLLQRRLCFYTGPHPPPFITPADEVTCLPLTSQNVYQVLHATTCLPFMSERCEYIAGVGSGLFFDGALSDYHLNLASTPEYPLLLLGDGPGPAFKQTLWDAYTWRRAPSQYRRNVTVLYPTQQFVECLEAGKLPTVFDYFSKQYIADPPLRQRHWRQAYDLSLSHFPGHPLDVVQEVEGHKHTAAAALPGVQAVNPAAACIVYIPVWENGVRG